MDQATLSGSTSCVASRKNGRVSEPATIRPRRFGYGFKGTGRESLVAAVRSAERFGYDTFIMPDHLADQVSPLPTLAVVAELSQSLRIAPWVLCNDFHLPQVLARELATLDSLSGGRLDVGLGAGWLREEYVRAGIAFDTGAERFLRLKDSVAIIKALLAGGPVTMRNSHHHLHEHVGSPPPAQLPHAPLMLGGGGRQMLTWAAAEADIVSIIPAAGSNGGLLASDLTMAALERKIGWVREGAGSQFDALTLNLAMIDVTITADRRAAARTASHALTSGQMPMFVVDAELTEDDLLESPYFAFGTAREIAGHVETVFARTGVSYYGLFAHLSEAFGPVLEHVER